MDMMLQGKTALVTGSTSGIGAGCARLLAAEGVRVAINGRNRERAEAVAADIRAVGGDAEIVLGDINDPGEAEAVVARVNAAFGGLDILVNNVGNITHEFRASLFTTPIADWVSDYEQNLVASVRLILAFAPAMVERGWGRVIQISSRSAIAAMPSLATYGAAKAAINHMTVSLSKELSKTGVTSNAVMPGVIYTPAVEGWFADLARRYADSDDIEAGKAYYLAHIADQAVNRLGSPEDIAAAVCYLASPRSDFVTGTTIMVDGGASAA